MKYCGIDCGASGAVAFIDGLTSTAFDMPVKSSVYGGTVVDLGELFELIYQNSPDFICFEKQAVTSQTGKVAAFAMGRNYQAIIHAIEKYSAQGHKHISIVCVTPQQWKKTLGVMTGKTKDEGKKNAKEKKEKTIQLVKSLFPDAPIYGKKGGLKDGRCDALAIAEYGRRKY